MYLRSNRNEPVIDDGDSDCEMEFSVEETPQSSVAESRDAMKEPPQSPNRKSFLSIGQSDKDQLNSPFSEKSGLADYFAHQMKTLQRDDDVISFSSGGVPTEIAFLNDAQDSATFSVISLNEDFREKRMSLQTKSSAQQHEYHSPRRGRRRSDSQDRLEGQGSPNTVTMLPFPSSPAKSKSFSNAPLLAGPPLSCPRTPSRRASTRKSSEKKGLVHHRRHHQQPRSKSRGRSLRVNQHSSSLRSHRTTDTSGSSPTRRRRSCERRLPLSPGGKHVDSASERTSPRKSVQRRPSEFMQQVALLMEQQEQQEKQSPRNNVQQRVKQKPTPSNSSAFMEHVKSLMDHRPQQNNTPIEMSMDRRRRRACSSSPTRRPSRTAAPLQSITKPRNRSRSIKRTRVRHNDNRDFFN